MADIEDIGEMEIVCGHVCCPTPTSEDPKHFHRQEPWDCGECLEVTNPAASSNADVAELLDAPIAGTWKPVDLPDVTGWRQIALPPDGVPSPSFEPPPPRDLAGRYEPTQAELDDIANRFTYHPPKDGQPARFIGIRGAALRYAEILVECCPPSRERSLALTHLEDTVMWANAAIARNE